MATTWTICYSHSHKLQKTWWGQLRRCEHPTNVSWYFYFGFWQTPPRFSVQSRYLVNIHSFSASRKVRAPFFPSHQVFSRVLTLLFYLFSRPRKEKQKFKELERNPSTCLASKPWPTQQRRKVRACTRLFTLADDSVGAGKEVRGNMWVAGRGAWDSREEWCLIRVHSQGLTGLCSEKVFTEHLRQVAAHGAFAACAFSLFEGCPFFHHTSGSLRVEINCFFLLILYHQWLSHSLVHNKCPVCLQ